MGCLLYITCGVPDSWSCEFNPCKCYTFLILHFHARYFGTILTPFLTDMVTPFSCLEILLPTYDSLPSPCSLGSNLILEYLIYINLIVPYQHKTKLFWMINSLELTLKFTDSQIMYLHSVRVLALPSEFCGSCTSQLYRYNLHTMTYQHLGTPYESAQFWLYTFHKTFCHKNLYVIF